MQNSDISAISPAATQRAKGGRSRRYKTLLWPLLCVMTAWIPVSCSGSGAKVNQDSGAVDSPVADTVAAAPAAEILLTARGLDTIGIGMRTGDIPQSKDGVYDFVSAEDGYEGTNTYIFVRGESPLFTAYEFTPGIIDVISAESPLVAVAAPDGSRLHLGDEFAQVLSLPGVQAEWENADGDGMWCWQWEGLWFQPDQSRLSEELSRELYSDVAPPATSSFTSEVKIGYIGTGLPW